MRQRQDPDGKNNLGAADQPFIPAFSVEVMRSKSPAVCLNRTLAEQSGDESLTPWNSRFVHCYISIENCKGIPDAESDFAEDLTGSPQEPHIRAGVTSERKLLFS